MQKRRLGQTDIEVSVLGLGTVKFGRNQAVKYPSAFSLPSDHEIDLLLSTASDLGINLLDTAPAYGSSEERLGNALKGRRHEWIISSKAGESFAGGHSYFDFSPSAIRLSVEQSLRQLKTDYLDILLIHSNGDDERLIEDGVFTLMSDLKKEGWIRAYGMSTKTVAGGLLTINLSDLAMVTFNPAYTDEREVITEAHQQQKGLFIKKAFASGHLDKLNAPDPITHALQFVFAEPGVTSVIVGTLNPAHLKQNAKALMYL